MCAGWNPQLELVGDFFPLALRNELPAIESELNGLARLRCEYPVAGVTC